VDARLNPLLSKLRRVLGPDSVRARITIPLHTRTGPGSDVDARSGNARDADTGPQI
jgi:hypothetical protein